MSASHAATSERNVGLLLMVAAAALAIANSPFAKAHHGLFHGYAGLLTVHDWIADALMAVFFLLVGLEVKRMVTGSWRRRRHGACR